MLQKLKTRLKKLGRYQFLVGLSTFVLIFGIVGVTFEFVSHAQSYGEVVGNGSKCLDNTNDVAANENKIQLWQCLNDGSQQWFINGGASNSGTIVNQNGYCLGILNGGTSNGTHVILYQCDGLPTQQWYYDAQGGQIVNLNSGTCLDDLSSLTANGSTIDIWSCNGSAAQRWSWTGDNTPPPTCPPGYFGTYPNCVAPSCPSGDTGTYPNCVAPSCPSGDTGTYPNCVAPTCPSGDTGTYPNCVAPSPGGGGGSGGGGSGGGSGGGGSSGGGGDNTGGSGSSSGGGGDNFPTLSLNDLGSPSNNSTDLNTTTTTPGTSQTVIYNPGGGSIETISTGNGPTISNLTVNHITSSSVIISWNVSEGSSYLIKYGLSANKLTKSYKYSNPNTSVLITLSGLPAGKEIYVSIAPTAGDTAGSVKTLHFKTTAASGGIGSFVLAFILFVLLILFVLFIVRRLKSPQYAQEEIPIPVDMPPPFPKESEQAYNQRVNWWLPDDAAQQQEAVEEQKKQDEYPDMFEEGRHRLEEEEREHKLPRQ